MYGELKEGEFHGLHWYANMGPHNILYNMGEGLSNWQECFGKAVSQYESFFDVDTHPFAKQKKLCVEMNWRNNFKEAKAKYDGDCADGIF